MHTVNTLTNTDVVFQNDQRNHYWIDRSPYAFQMWKQSAASTLNMTTYEAGFRRHIVNPDVILLTQRLTPLIQRYKPCSQCISYIEPQANPTVNCTAAAITADGINKWIKIPCTQKKRTVIICEKHKDPSLQQTAAHMTSYIECPPKAIHLSSTCIRVYTLVGRNGHDANNICTVKKSTLFHIPSSIASRDPLWYNEREIYFVSFLKAMNHRWPGLADYEAALTDELIMASVNSTEPIIFRFALTTISHVEIDSEKGRIEGAGAAHVVCEIPLSPVSSNCLSGHFTCYDGTCVLEHYVCDGVTDCPDSTDEVDCDHVCTFADGNDATGMKDCFSSCATPVCTCNDLYFHCTLGGCIPWSRICNGVNDCPNDEDEKVCEFYYLGSLRHITQNIDTLNVADDIGPFSEEFYCGGGKTIPLTLKNDLVPDCLDQSDEEEYHNFLKQGSKTTYSTNMSLCDDPEQTTCVQNFPRVCYPRHLYCTHELYQLDMVGCRNGAHLSNCQYHTCPSQFKCPDAYCIPMHSICDGKQDCPDGDDEIQCQSLSCPGFLLCRHDNICVHQYDVWRDHVKCPISIDDKALTNVPRCPPLCLCLGYAISCKSSEVGDLPQLPSALRRLLLDSVQININKVKFREGITFLLDLQITNASLDQLQRKHLLRFVFLKNLNLSYNSLKSLEQKTFFTLHNLEKMDLSHNSLDAVSPDTFIGLRLLRHLSLNHNGIKHMSHCTFENLNKLEILNLSHNKLTHLGKNILCGLNVKELDVGYNYLSMIDEKSFVDSLQHLKTLNTFPWRICCNVPKEVKCYPKANLTPLSSCSRLFDSSNLRKILWCAGSILSSLVFPSVAWYINQIRVRGNSKSVYNVLLLLLLASHLYVCIYFFTILSIDHFSANYYSFFDETWRQHTVCSLLNILSYVFFQTTPFVCILISCVRVIGTVYPFKAQDISMWALLVSILLWFLVSMCLGYSGIAWIFPEYHNSPESALGLGLLLPSLRHDERYVPFNMLVFIIPNATILLFFCCSQARLLLGLNGTSAISDASQLRQKKAIRTSVTALLLFILEYCPLLLVHILTLFQVSIKVNVKVIVTIWTLFIIPVGNVLLYVLVTNDFLYLFSKIWHHFSRY